MDVWAAMRNRGNWRRGFRLLALCGALASAAVAHGEQGIRGRASAGGVLVEGLTVRAYPHGQGTFGPLTGAVHVAEATTDTDGSYRLPLPPGRYVVEGLQKAPGNQEPGPQTGDLYCLYSGSPVAVASAGWTAVGLNLIRVPEERRQAAERSVLSGTVTFAGEPQPKVYLYLYADAASGFRGPARLLQPVAKGRFRVRVPPGTYYLVARKRLRGGAYGPIEIGDLFNYYPRNPVTVATGEEVVLEVPLIERLSQLEEDPEAFTGVPTRVVDAAGNPLAGFYVLAYALPARTGPPLATSGATDAQGRTRLPFTPGQTWYLRARQTLGGPMEEGQPFADGELSGPLAPGAAELTLTVGP